MRERRPITAPTPPAAPRPRAAKNVSASRTRCYKTLQKATAKRALFKHPKRVLNPWRYSASSAFWRLTFHPARTKAHHHQAKSAERTHVPSCLTRHNPPQPAQIRQNPPLDRACKTNPRRPTGFASRFARMQNKPTKPQCRAAIKHSADRRAKQTHQTHPPLLGAGGASLGCPSLCPGVFQGLAMAAAQEERGGAEQQCRRRGFGDDDGVTIL